MPTPLHVLEAEVLSLPPQDREHLLERLIASLDADPAVHAAWVEEALRRDAEIEGGKSAAVDGRQLVADLRAGLQ
jgi:putative addiction module component (TIGR02574 family)